MVENKITCKVSQKKCMEEVGIYQDRLWSFGRQLAMESIKTMQPDEWWRVCGHSALNIQKLAIRILSQTSSSSSGCERNWNVFEQIHTKKRNRLEHARFNDLVFVHYNLCLKERLSLKKKSFDPVDYESIDDVEFWIMEEEINQPLLDIDELEGIPNNEDNLSNPTNISYEGGSNVANEMDNLIDNELDSFVNEMMIILQKKKTMTRVI